MVMLLSSIAVHAYFKLDRKEQVYRLFLALIGLTILILLLEILSVVLNSGHYINFISVHKLVDTLGFMLSPLVPISAVLYVYKRINKNKKTDRSKFFYLSMPFIVNGLISLGSYKFNWIFGITVENMYVRGALFFVSPLTLYFYYIINLFFLYDSRKKVNKEELIILSLLTIMPAVLSVIQGYYFIYLTIWNSVAIAVIINYIFIIQSQTKIDPLTGLGNRVLYNEYLASSRRKNNLVLAVINIDLDNFKSINDVYGHQEGDKALRLFARQLEEVFEGKGISIRLGGDEFIVLINDNQKEVVEQYIKTLSEKMNVYNKKSGRAYCIEFSYGMVMFNNEYDSIDELIQHSDRLMYEDKKKNCNSRVPGIC
ncbi:MAG: GGDEF domain-containing protein [Pelosinus sp.]|nr:GGDEF domain-containing protein [Pelosinus sp.]